MNTCSPEPGQLADWIHAWNRQSNEVQQLAEVAPDCPEFPDLLSTIRQATETAEAELEGPPEAWTGIDGKGFRVTCESIPMDLSALSPAKVAQHITAFQQRAVLLGLDLLNTLMAQARAGPEQEWRRAVIEGISPTGKYLVEWLPSARETCFEAHTSDLKLVPPIAGAFWTPKKPPPYDPSLPAYPVTYSEEEKAAQREAYDKHAQGVKDAIAGGKSEYTFPPGVYRSREKITLEGTTDFTLTLANVEWVSEEDSFLYLRCNTNVTIRGPVNFDADPFRVSQCEVVDTDGETYLDLQVMPKYADPTPKEGEGKFLIFDHLGKSFPTGQVWAKGCPADLGNGCFRMEFDENNKHVLTIPGLAKAGNFLTMLGGPGGIQLSCNQGVTLEHFTTYCGGEVWGFEYGVDRFHNLRALRRPGTSRLFAGGKFYQGGSFLMDRCEVAYNDDDLSDIFSWLGFTTANAGSASSIYAIAQEWQAGQHLHIYDCRNLETVGRAVIKSIDHCKDEAALEELNRAFKTAGMREKGIDDFRLIDLEEPVDISGRLCIIDCKEGKPQRISVTNCYFHDGLNCGIDCKGAHEILIANNVVDKTRIAGINAAEDHWWGEGGMAGDVMIRNNTVHNSFYQYGQDGLQEGPSITAYATGLDDEPSGLQFYTGVEKERQSPVAAPASARGSGCPINNVRVVGNLAVDPRSKPINVTQCDDVVICGNLPADALPSNASGSHETA